MKTATKIEIAYRVAKMVERDHADLLEITENEEEIEVRKNDPTGYHTSEWTIWVNKKARRQYARVYVPATGYESAISASDADMVIVLDADPETVVEQTKYLNDAARIRR